MPGGLSVERQEQRLHNDKAQSLWVEHPFHPVFFLRSGKEKETKKVKQISVSLENNPRNLAHFYQRLADRNIDITVISVIEYALHSVVRMVVDNPLAALKILDECCLAYDETDVLLVDLPNSRSALAELARKPTIENIDVNFAYISASPDGEKFYIVIGTPNNEVAMKALRHKK